MEKVWYTYFTWAPSPWSGETTGLWQKNAQPVNRNTHPLFSEYRHQRQKEFSSRRQQTLLLVNAVWIPNESEDIKRVVAPTQLGKKNTFWNRTGNLSLARHNALTAEPRLLVGHMKLWNIVVYAVELQKKNFQCRKHVGEPCCCLPTLA